MDSVHRFTQGVRDQYHRLLQIYTTKRTVKIAEQISGSLVHATDRLTLLASGNLKEEVVFADSNQEARTVQNICDPFAADIDV